MAKELWSPKAYGEREQVLAVAQNNRTGSIPLLFCWSKNFRVRKAFTVYTRGLKLFKKTQLHFDSLDVVFVKVRLGKQILVSLLCWCQTATQASQLSCQLLMAQPHKMQPGGWGIPACYFWIKLTRLVLTQTWRENVKYEKEWKELSETLVSDVIESKPIRNKFVFDNFHVNETATAI